MGISRGCGKFVDREVSHLSRVEVKQVRLEPEMDREQGNRHPGWPEHMLPLPTDTRLQ